MKKILLTGVIGYIGKRMISVIVSQGDKVSCCRDANRFENVMELDDKNKIGQKALLRPKGLWEDYIGLWYFRFMGLFLME